MAQAFTSTVTVLVTQNLEIGIRSFQTPTGNKGCDSHHNEEKFIPFLAEQAEIKVNPNHPLIAYLNVMVICGAWSGHVVFFTKAGKPLCRFCKPVIRKEWRGGGRIKISDAMKDVVPTIHESSVADKLAQKYTVEKDKQLREQCDKKAKTYSLKIFRSKTQE